MAPAACVPHVHCLPTQGLTSDMISLDVGPTGLLACAATDSEQAWPLKGPAGRLPARLTSRSPSAVHPCRLRGCAGGGRLLTVAPWHPRIWPRLCSWGAHRAARSFLGLVPVGSSMHGGLPQDH